MWRGTHSKWKRSSVPRPEWQFSPPAPLFRLDATWKWLEHQAKYVRPRSWCWNNEDLTVQEPRRQGARLTRSKSHPDGFSLYRKLDHMGPEEQIVGPVRIRLQSGRKKGSRGWPRLSCLYDIRRILWIRGQYFRSRRFNRLCIIVDFSEPLSINMKSRTASKKHADMIRERNHRLQTGSGMCSLCSGPNTRYRLTLDHR